MTVRRKLLLAFAAFIVAVSACFMLLTHIVVKVSLSHIKIADRSREMAELTAVFGDSYTNKGGSWAGVSQEASVIRQVELMDPSVSLLLVSRNGEVVYRTGPAKEQAVRALGLREKVTADGRTVADLYFHDPESANLSKIQLGISSSVTVLLSAGTIVLTLVALGVAYRVSNRLTRPLQELVGAIERLGGGERGVHARVLSRDEYGKVAAVFNGMSDKLRESEEVRRNLVADVAHELRTPIAIIRGKLELLQQTGGSIDPHSLLPLQDELIRLTRLVDDLHLLSLAEARMLPVEPRPTDPAELLSRVVQRVEPEAVERGIRIALDIRSTADTMIDPNRTAQVFLNLLTNAVRYSPEGGAVSVVTEIENERSGAGRTVRITVTDSGPGIAPRHLPFIFDRFYRTDEARARQSGGMGLGLAIAKAFVQAQDGTIEAVSAPGRGATFIVRLPVSRTT